MMFEYCMVPLPPYRKVVGSKWIYKNKMAADGTAERYKARLVAQGCTQKHGTGYDETFSPLIRGEAVSTMLVINVQEGLMIHQMDVDTAFLNGEQQNVYMKQPEWFVQDETLVFKLKRSIYRLKQLPRYLRHAG